jgi:hypothetical protein
MTWRFRSSPISTVPTGTGGLVIHLWTKMFQVLDQSSVLRLASHALGAKNATAGTLARGSERTETILLSKASGCEPPATKPLAWSS